MKSKILKVTAIAACMFIFAACGGDDEPKVQREISVTTYESLSPKGSEFYNPKEWIYTNTMLFTCTPSDIDKTASTVTLQNGKLTLTSGGTLPAKYKSDTGIIYDAEYGNYTLVVYCTTNPFNAYLEKRWTCQQFNYTKNNSVASINCCFVWGDMATSGGFYNWQNK